MAKHTAAVLSEAIRAAAGSAAENDRELLRRFTEGEQEAFATLFRRHATMVLGVCRRALPCVQDAEDACQAAFLLLSRKAASGHWQPSVANWLYLTARRIARNARVAAQRRARREGRVAVPEAVQPVDRMTGRELLDVLDAELDHLPPSYREPLVLCYLEGLARDEAAARLGVPLTTVKIRLERGRKRLGDALTKRGCLLGAGLLALAVTSPAGAAPSRLVASVLAAAAGRAPAGVAALARGVAVRGLVGKSVGALLLLAGAAALALGVLSAGPPAAALPPREPQSEQAAAAAATKENQPAPPADRTAPRTVTGRVVGPDGKPVAGAKLFVPGARTTGFTVLDDAEARIAGTTDADGRFSVTVAPRGRALVLEYLVAYAPGLGLDWLQFYGPDDPALDGEQTLYLPKDVPIRGRLVNTEGRPMSGVSVAVDTISVPANGTVDDYLARWKGNIYDALYNPWKQLALLPREILGAATTDPGGRFTVHGGGAERIVYVTITGGGVARSNAYVVTREGFDPKPYNEILLRKQYDFMRTMNGFLGLYAPELTFITRPGKEISGVVSDAVTGEPVPGCTVSTRGGFRDVVHVRTDDRGRYRLTGVPKPAKDCWISVYPPDETTYLSQHPQFADADGFAPVRHDVRLVKGAVVTGRVVDQQTGKGVWAGIRFAPLPENKFFDSGPEHRESAPNRNVQATDRDGRFRLITIPGPTLVMAHAIALQRLAGDELVPYRRATPDPDHKDRFQRNGDSWSIPVSGSGNTVEILSSENAVRVIDVKTTGETDVELSVDPGRTAEIAVQDADGQPLAGAWVAGVADRWPIVRQLQGATGTVYGLDPARPRKLHVYHAGKRLAATLTIRADEKEPVVAKLQPLGRVVGRLLDADGRPFAGAAVSLVLNSEIDHDLYRYAIPDGRQAVTGKDGRFTLDTVVPGIWFYLGIRKGNETFGTTPKLGPRTVRPGQTSDVGDRTVGPAS
jgi:RNA polymerase sigma factor (sigma-70 family)